MPVTATDLASAVIAGTGTSKTLAIGAVPAGSTLVAAIAHWSSAVSPTSGVTAPGGAAMTKLGGTDGSNYHISIWAAYTATGFAAGNVTYTFSTSLSSGSAAHACYLTGADTSADPRDGGASGTSSRIRTAGTTNPYSSNTITTATPNLGLVGFAYLDGTVNNANQGTPGSGYSKVGADTNDTVNQWGTIMQFRAVSATGSYAADGSWAATSGTIADLVTVVSFKEAAPGGPVATRMINTAPMRRQRI